VAGRREHGIGRAAIERALRCEPAKLGGRVRAGECGTIDGISSQALVAEHLLGEHRARAIRGQLPADGTMIPALLAGGTCPDGLGRTLV
jgi:hypothetical protein